MHQKRNDIYQIRVTLILREVNIMVQLKLTSQLKKFPFNFTKSKSIAVSIKLGLDRNQIIYKYCIKNEFQIDSFERRNEIIKNLYQRLIQLDLYLLNAFIESDIVTSKFILLYAIAKTDPLFTDFLSEVYRDALLGEKKYISMDDFDRYFYSKKEINSVVHGWSNTTIELLSKAYRKLLIDASLGMRKIKNIYINQLIIHPDIFKYIKQIGDYKYLQAILGEH